MQQLSLDIQKTKALLIGVSDYQFLPPIAPALRNIEDLAAILTDSNIFGLPVENVIKVINQRNDEIFDAIVGFLENSDNINIETLLFYYVGHGIREKTSKELYLTGVNTKNTNITSSAIHYNEIKKCIENSQLQKRIVILDACHSGLATQGENQDVYTEPELDIKGTFVLASSSDSEKSFFDTSGQHTFFTEEIVKLLKNGLAEPKPVISLDDIYFYVKKNLKHSTPRRNTNLDTHDFYLFRNCQYDSVRILIHEADLLFDQGEVENARLKYLEALRKNRTPTDELDRKIDQCENLIQFKKKILQHQEELRIKEEKEKTEFFKRLQDLELSKKAEAERIENEKRANLLAEQRLKELQEKAEQESLHQQKLKEERIRQQKLKKEQFVNLKRQQEFEAEKKAQEEEAVYWQSVKKENTLSAYHNYLTKYPKGKFVIEAKKFSDVKRLEELRIKEEKEISEQELLQQKNLKEEQEEQNRLKQIENAEKAKEERLRQKKLKEEQAANLKRNKELETTNKAQEEKEDWQTAIKENTLSGFQNYIDKYSSQGKFVTKANQYIEEFQTNNDQEEIRYWESVVKENTLIAYRNYLLKYSPDGRFAGEANKVIRGKQKKRIFIYILIAVVAIATIIYFTTKGPSARQTIEQQLRESQRVWDSILADSLNKIEEKDKKAGITWQDNNTGYFTDQRDNHKYNVVKIGTQVWIAENFAYKVNKGCWAYNNDVSNVIKYGYLYDWETAKKIAPAGWHLPSDEEWKTLENYLGQDTLGGGKMKSVSALWKRPNAGATNQSGFSALPGGFRYFDGISNYIDIGVRGSWWTIKEIDGDKARIYSVKYNSSLSWHNDAYEKIHGFSVRYIRDY